MVLKLKERSKNKSFRFENDVEMYGAQTLFTQSPSTPLFENDVEMYGAQTVKELKGKSVEFENDVEMYGAQTSSTNA